MAGLQSFSGLDWSNGERSYLQDYAKKAKKQFMFGMVTKPVTVSTYIFIREVISFENASI